VGKPQNGSALAAKVAEDSEETEICPKSRQTLRRRYRELSGRVERSVGMQRDRNTTFSYREDTQFVGMSGPSG